MSGPELSEIVFLYVTAPNSETAARIARPLVEEKLVACVNIHAEMRSVYEWEGQVEIGLETPMLVKTTHAAAGAARDRIIALHPYDEPCVVALPVAETGSSRSFLDWIKQATSA
ncbi:divalent-cation tolerance protein CutA [Hyphococcus luteus]|uniref:Divalent-cation tolerance protein CutA n=1 Tax=Hyphococcus luteus TaxID=2058213 RepID=A0A2S7K989_9PROT|nr:divalent-cation tolerance protein CutA [Marinicaulis flavus]PQA89048.1 divalent-cation tolerance protein CutA [Marinicaulis flavus]